MLKIEIQYVLIKIYTSFVFLYADEWDVYCVCNTLVGKIGGKKK